MSKQPTLRELEAEFRNRHGMFDCGTFPGSADERDVWVGEEAGTGERVAYRIHAALEGNAAHDVARYFLHRRACAESQAMYRGGAATGKVETTFVMRRMLEVPRGDGWALVDTDYVPTTWGFASKWAVRLEVDRPLLVASQRPEDVGYVARR